MAQALSTSLTASSCKLQLARDGRKASCHSGEGPADGLRCLSLYGPKSHFQTQTCLQPVQRPHIPNPAFRSTRFTYHTEVIYESITMWPIQKMPCTLEGGLETNAVTTTVITFDLQKWKRKPGLGSLIAELTSCQTRKEH